MNAKHILLGLLFLFSLEMSSQIIVPIENESETVDWSGKYFKDINGHFNKFIGTWEYSSSDKYFKVQFYKVAQIMYIPFWASDTYHDYLCTFIEYKELQNGQWVTIYNTFGTPILANSSSDYRNTIYGNGVMSTNPNIIGLMYTEPSEGCRNLSTYLSVTYQMGRPAQIIWKRNSRSWSTGNFCPEGQIDNSGYKIPSEMILTKVP